MKKKDSCVLCFVKYPEKGKVKHRLAVDLDEGSVVELYRNFVEDVVSVLKKIDATPIICFSPISAEKKFKEWLGSSYTYSPQQGDTLGERMKNSFSTVFKQGIQRAVLIGSDSPDLPFDFLRNAFTELQTHDMVLGPSSDGGYYLIGFRKETFLPSVFEGIAWSSQRVFTETITRIKNAGCSVSLLPVWSDIDTITDLKNLISRSKNTAFKSSHTITYLQKHIILLEHTNEGKRET
jgi:rSAM/selenodomain-associated transferase 1